ncbi:MAG: hydroxyacylglutathione hydrolase [Halieaceae bacterium]|jgi:hydroxyacylglutathione hydrolase|nr:hydroxyacylglutathione hydrolase [Halieaceae bacterium]
MQIEPIPAFNDNYIWLLDDGVAAWVVDPGDAEPVLARLASRSLSLAGILVTHHHPDHVGGLQKLVEKTGCRVLGPKNPSIKQISETFAEGDTADLLGCRFKVLAVPGHTLDHIAWYCESAKALFCGDTLFAGGCGRIFEGDAPMMYASLEKLAALPADTRVYCAHEYTLANLDFARTAEPHNSELLARDTHCRLQRQRGEPTVPSTVGMERATNPFLRPHSSDIVASLRASGRLQDTSEVGVFAALRAWKDNF